MVPDQNTPESRAFGAAQRRRRCAFTLIELLVAITLLSLIILGLSQVFRTVGRSMRTSNATMETDANARAVLRQFAGDVSHIDRSGFLVIRSNTIYRGATVRSQIAFITHGTQGNRTGAMDPNSAASADLAACAAHVWWGVALNPVDLDNNSNANPNTSIVQSDGVQLTDRSASDNTIGNAGNPCYLGRHVFLLLPANSAPNPNQVAAPSGTLVPAHVDIARTAGTIPVRVSSGETQAHPASGRTSVAAITSSQLMARMRLQKFQPVTVPAYLSWPNTTSYEFFMRGLGVPMPCDGVFGGSQGATVNGLVPQYDGSDYWYEARYFCYPFKVLREPREGTNSTPGQVDYINGTNRMSGVVLKYCLEFKIDWSDGQTDATGNLRWIGQDAGNCLDSLNDATNILSRQWPPVDFYGAIPFNSASDYNARSIYPTVTDTASRPMNINGAFNKFPAPYNSNLAITRDTYDAVFGFDNRTQWPKALRITMSVRMPEMETGTNASTVNLPVRTYTQIVWVPQ